MSTIALPIALAWAAGILDVCTMLATRIHTGMGR